MYWSVIPVTVGLPESGCLLPLASIRKECRAPYASPGKFDHSSKFEVQFLLNAYGLRTIVSRTIISQTLVSRDHLYVVGEELLGQGFGMG